MYIAQPLVLKNIYTEFEKCKFCFIHISKKKISFINAEFQTDFNKLNVSQKFLFCV